MLAARMAQIGKGPVAVLAPAPLPRLLGDLGVPVVALAHERRVLRQGVRVQADAAALPFRDGALAALVHVGSCDDPRVAAEWSRVLAEGGLAIVVAGEPREETTAFALLAGWVDIEQRACGRAYLTTGLLRRL
jgi:hypothetical protein